MMSRQRMLALVLRASCAVPCAACMSNAVVFHTSTRLAIEIQTTEEQPGVKVGYQRFEGVTMPLRIPDENPDGSKPPHAGELLPEAYPVLAGFMQSSSGFWPSPDKPIGTRVKQVFATGAAAKEPNAPAAVISALDARAAPLVGMPSLSGSKLGRELLTLLEKVPKGQQDAAFKALSDDLGVSVLSMEEARYAVQDAAGESGREASLEKALEHIRPMAK